MYFSLFIQKVIEKKKIFKILDKIMVPDVSRKNGQKVIFSEDWCKEEEKKWHICKEESAKSLTQGPAKCVRPRPVFQTWQTDRHLFTKGPGLWGHTSALQTTSISIPYNIFRAWPKDFVMMFMKIYDVPFSPLASFRCYSASEEVNHHTALDKSTPAWLFPSGMFCYAAHYNQWKQHDLTLWKPSFSNVFWASNLHGLHIEQFDYLETVK